MLTFCPGEKSVTSPCKVPHRYCVMDWMKVTHAWAERCPISGCIRWKFRFEKLSFDTDGWWSVESTPTTEKSIMMRTCVDCGTSCAEIYTVGWFCTMPTCEQFWKVNMPCSCFLEITNLFQINGLPVLEYGLEYTEAFKYAGTPWPKELEVAPTPLCPTFNTQWDEVFDVLRRSWKGFCCPVCRKLNSKKWGGGLKCCFSCGYVKLM